MIVYEASKGEFLEHVDKDVIVSHILNQFELKLGRTSESEIRSWDNSMLHMYRVLNDESIPDDAGVAIEYKVPYTSKRVDFLLSGHDAFRGQSPSRVKRYLSEGLTPFLEFRGDLIEIATIENKNIIKR